MLNNKFDLLLSNQHQSAGLLMLSQLMSDSDCDTVENYSDLVSRSNNCKLSELELESESENSALFQQETRSFPDSNKPEHSYQPTDNDSNNDDGELTVNPEIPLILVHQNNKISYSFMKKIARGSYGEVSIYQTSVKNAKKFNLPREVCVKTGINIENLDNDIKVIKTLKNTTCQDTIVNSIVLESTYLNKDGDLQKVPILVMEKYDGNLKQFFCNQYFSSLRDKFAVILYNLSKITTCFYHLVNRNLYYTDIKINNCVYQIENQMLRVAICDLGSAFFGNEKKAIATYPNIYRHRCHHFIPNCYDLVYGILMLFFEMMCFSHHQQTEWTITRELFDNFYFKKIYLLNVNDRLNLIETLFSELESICENDDLLLSIIREFKSLTITTDISEFEKIKTNNYMFKMYNFLKQSYQKLLPFSNNIKEIDGIIQLTKSKK